MGHRVRLGPQHVLWSRVITCRVARTTVYCANAENGHSSAMYVARGLRYGTAIEQEADVARSFTGSFGFVTAATDGKGV